MNTQEAPQLDFSLLESRRQEALSIADRCREILQENFGAIRVFQQWLENRADGASLK